MSHAHDAHSSQAHDAHEFDGEPVKELAHDEPRTPPWVPALGVLLFVGAAIALLVCGQDDVKTPANTAPDSAAAGAAPQAKVPATPPSIIPNPMQNAAPGASGNPTIQRLSPEQAKALQQRVEEARARQAAQGGQPQAAPGGQPGTTAPSRPEVVKQLQPLPTPTPTPRPEGAAQ